MIVLDYKDHRFFINYSPEGPPFSWRFFCYVYHFRQPGVNLFMKKACKSK